MIRGWLFCVSLFFRCRVGKGWQRGAGLFDLQQPRVHREIAAKTPRVGQLGYETYIRQGWRVVEAKRSSFWGGGYCLFERGQAEINPVPRPTVQIIIRLLQIVLEMDEYPEVLNRVDFTSNDKRHAAHQRAICRIGRK